MRMSISGCRDVTEISWIPPHPQHLIGGKQPLIVLLPRTFPVPFTPTEEAANLWSKTQKVSEKNCEKIPFLIMLS